MSKLMDEVKRLESFPIKHPYVVDGDGIAILGRTGILIRHRGVPTETLELIVEAMNWFVKKKALMDLLARFDTPVTVARGSQTTSVTGLTRLALQLKMEPEVFREVDANLQKIRELASRAWLKTPDGQKIYDTWNARIADFEIFHQKFVENLLDDDDVPSWGDARGTKIKPPLPEVSNGFKPL